MMKSIVFKNVEISYQDGVLHPEIVKILEEQLKKFKNMDKVLGFLEIKIDANDLDLIVTAKEKSPIKRVRRITGYLTNLENFNDAKSQECSNRVNH